MSDDPIDLSSLRDALEQSVEDRVVKAVLQRVASDRATEPDIVAAIWSLARPTLIAATLVIGIGGSIVLQARPARLAAPTTIWQSFGLPVAVERWAATGAVDPGELLDELRGHR
jgi:hypothetical protein